MPGPPGLDGPKVRKLYMAIVDGMCQDVCTVCVVCVYVCVCVCVLCVYACMCVCVCVCVFYRESKVSLVQMDSLALQGSR